VGFYPFQPESGGGAVSSVFGRTGAVTADTGDYDAAEITGALALQQTTGTSGYTLIDGTGNVMPGWTVPNDGAIHRALICGETDVTSAETGGQLQVTFIAPNGANASVTVDAGGHGSAGITPFTVVYAAVEAGSTVTVVQRTALTAGAAVAWAEIWGC
jgi:hypothetical protein